MDSENYNKQVEIDIVDEDDNSTIVDEFDQKQSHDSLNIDSTSVITGRDGMCGVNSFEDVRYIKTINSNTVQTNTEIDEDFNKKIDTAMFCRNYCSNRRPDKEMDTTATSTTLTNSYMFEEPKTEEWKIDHCFECKVDSYMKRINETEFYGKLLYVTCGANLTNKEKIERLMAVLKNEGSRIQWIRKSYVKKEIMEDWKQLPLIHNELNMCRRALGKINALYDELQMDYFYLTERLSLAKKN